MSPTSRYLCDGHLLRHHDSRCHALSYRYHPVQPAGPDRVAGTDVISDDHLLSLKAACVMITNDHILTLKAASNEH